MKVLVELRDFSYETLMRIAKETLDSDVLSELSKVKQNDVRICVAENTNCSDSTLLQLASECDFWKVRYFVAKNPSASESTLAKICEECRRRVNEIKKIEYQPERDFQLGAEQNVLDGILLNPNVTEEIKEVVQDMLKN